MDKENLVPVFDTTENVTLRDGEIAILATGTHIMNIDTYFDLVRRAKKEFETECMKVVLNPETTSTTFTPEQIKQTREGMKRLAEEVLGKKNCEKENECTDFKNKIPRLINFSRELMDYCINFRGDVNTPSVVLLTDYEKLNSTIVLDSEGNLFASKKAAEMYHGLPKSTVSKIAIAFPTMKRTMSYKLKKYVTFREVNPHKAFPWIYNRWKHGNGDLDYKTLSFVLSDGIIDKIAKQNEERRGAFLDDIKRSNGYYLDLIQDMKDDLTNLANGARNAR